MLDLTEAFDIEEALVTQWIREGRLRAIPLSPDAAARDRVQQQLRARVEGQGGRGLRPPRPARNDEEQAPMSRDAAVTALAERLDEALASQRRLLDLVVEQRPAIAGGRHAGG